MSQHLSDHAIGTTVALTWKRTQTRQYIARLHRRDFHNEVWNVYAVTGSGGESYLMSEGWAWINQQREQ